MLRLVANNRELDLGDIKSLSFKRKSTLFKFDDVQCSIVVPFTLPRTDNNEQIFNYYGNLALNYYDNTEVPVYIYHTGILFANAVLTIKKNTKKYYDCDVKLDLGIATSKIKDTKIADVPQGGDIAFTFKSDYNRIDDGYYITMVYNENTLKDTPFDGHIASLYAQNYMNFWNLATNEPMWIDPIDEGEQTIDVPMNVIVPFPFVERVLKNIFMHCGLTIGYNEFEQNADLNRLVIFNTVNACEKEYFERGTPTYYKPVLSTINIANHLPDISVATFLMDLAVCFCAGYLAENGSVRVLLYRDILRSADYIDYTSKVLKEYTKTNYNNDPGFNVQLTFDENDELLTDNWTVDDYDIPIRVDSDESPLWPSTPEPGNIVYYTATYPGMWLSYDYYEDRFLSVPRWDYPKEETYLIGNPALRFIRYMFQNFRSGAEGLSLDCGISLVGPKPLTGNEGETYYVPWVKQNVNHFFYNRAIVPFSFRLFFALGQDESRGMPMGHYKTDTTSLQWYDSGIGLYDNYWDDYIKWRDNIDDIEIEMTLELSVVELKNFDFARKYYINGQFYFITSLDFSLSLYDVSLVKATMIKAPPPHPN